MLPDIFASTRKIEFDAAHRIPDHGSKCRTLHGHRYVVEATIKGALADSGEQTGMTMDFTFLKEGMVKLMHDPCDHGLILDYRDPLLSVLAPEIAEKAAADFLAIPALQHWSEHQWHRGLKLYLIPSVPTAENLAHHWFIRFSEWVIERSDRVRLSQIVVHETPNCWAAYPAQPVINES